MSTASTKQQPGTRAAGAANGKKKREMKENKAGIFLTKVDKASRQTTTKSTRTEQARHLTKHPTRMQTRHAERHKPPVVSRESRYLRVAAVNQVRSDRGNCHQSTTMRRRPPGSTTLACTHPTTSAVSTTCSTTVTKKKTTNNSSAGFVSSSSVVMPDVVVVAEHCPKTQTTFTHVLSSSESALEEKAMRPSELHGNNTSDPDVGTESDPSLCTEYIKDIYKYLLELEARSVYAIRENFLSRQVGVRKHHRSILIDWLVQVHQKFILLPETLHLAINILDRSLQVSSVHMLPFGTLLFFHIANATFHIATCTNLLCIVVLAQVVVISKDELQLLGLTAMFIASKFEEIYPPSIVEFAYVAADTYTTDSIRKMEGTVLKQLDYQLNYPSAIMFLRRYSKLMETSKRVHNLAKYILELSLLEPTNSFISSSKKAGAALLLSASLINPLDLPQKLWCATLVVYSSYEVHHFRETKKRLDRALYDGHHSNKLRAIREKYATSDFLEVSKLKVFDKEGN